jgi:glucose/arabinose dehydrogenase
VSIRHCLIALFLAAAALPLAGCNEASKLPPQASFGPAPTLPEPASTLLPTINFAPAVGWREGGKPVPAADLAVNAFATGLAHPRWLYVLPNGDVLVAESNGPERPDEYKGLVGVVARYVMDKAGAGVASANRIALLRDADGDGVAEIRTVFLDQLNSPFGMALVGDAFYVANTDSLMRFTYRGGQTRITGPGEKVVDLPGGTVNHHWTKNVVANRAGGDALRLYVAVGSNSNVGENGLDKEAGRAAILEVDPATRQTRIFASGLRNPVGMDWEPHSGALWTAVNERDELGSDLVPDYMTSVRDGAFYGWPYSYFGQRVDVRVKPQRPDLVEKALAPDYALGTHTASLGLVFSRGNAPHPRFRDGVFIGQHGSWNRRPPSGYKVIFVPFAKGMPAGAPEDVLTGFLDAKGNAQGRPVGVVLDRRGALLVADDVGNTIWRVTAK